MKYQQAEFTERLARITDRRNTHYVDPETGMKIPKRVRKLPGVKSSPLRNLHLPLSVVLAFAMGMFAVAFSRYVRFHLIGLPEGRPDPDMMLLMDAAMGVATGFALRQLFRLQGRAQTLAQTVGIVAMICLMHNFVWMAPGLFSTVFSPEWVQSVRAVTEPQSIWFRGVTLTL